MKKLKRVLLVGLIVASILPLAGCKIKFKKKIDLNKYITITSSGYENYGTVSMDFDMDAFEEEYAGKIELTENYQDSNPFGAQEKKSVEEMLLEDCVEDTSFDKRDGLKNGDVVTLSLDLNNVIAEEYYNVELVYSEMTYTVNNLKTPGSFDPFDYITVSFAGISPNGTAIRETDYSVPEMEQIAVSFKDYQREESWFNYDDGTQMKDVKNGDEITVIVQPLVDDAYFLDQFGEEIVQREKTYTVTGLANYVEDISDIPQDLYDKMDQQLQDAFVAHAASKWSSDESATMELVGTYTMNAKDGADLSEFIYHQRVYFVYKINYSNPELEDFTYYWWGQFLDSTIQPDGTCSVDFSDYKVSEASSTWYKTSGDYLKAGPNNFVAGFSTIEDFENAYILPKVEAYTYEKIFKMDDAKKKV